MPIFPPAALSGSGGFFGNSRRKLLDFYLIIRQFAFIVNNSQDVLFPHVG